MAMACWDVIITLFYPVVRAKREVAARGRRPTEGEVVSCLWGAFLREWHLES